METINYYHGRYSCYLYLFTFSVFVLFVCSMSQLVSMRETKLSVFHVRKESTPQWPWLTTATIAMLDSELIAFSAAIVVSLVI